MIRRGVLVACGCGCRPRLLALLLALVPVEAACAPAAPVPAPGSRVLVVGWDGASFLRMDELVAAGRLPNVLALLRRGASARLESTAVPISSAAWTSAVTGKGPGDTGVYGFFEPVEGSYDVRLVSARSNRAPPLWRILGAHGRRSIVFGVPLTYPPEPILGTMVAGMLSPFDADYAWPPGLADRLRARGFEPDLETWRATRSTDAADVERQLALKSDVVRELLAGETWSFAMVVFKSLDVVSHRAYDADFAASVDPVYERLDEILGELLEAVGPGTDVLLVSDHGFRVYPAGFNVHAWLVGAGFAVLRDASPLIDEDPERTLAVREREAIVGLRERLDWSATRAFVQVTEGNFGALRLNLAGREPAGLVPPGRAGELLDALDAALRAERDERGRPVVRRVWRGAELYPGPEARVVPDLVFETVPDRQVFAETGTRVHGPYGIPIPDHDRTGVLVAAGPSFRATRERVELDVADLAPTVLHLLGLPVHAEMTGAAAVELLADGRAPEVVPEAEVAGRLGDDALERPFTPAQLAELEARLGRLGYGD